MIANWLGGMFVKLAGTIFIFILLIPFWFGLTLLSFKFWAWLFASGHAPQLFHRIREHFRVRNALSDGAHERFFHIIFSFFVVLFVIFVTVLIVTIC